MFKQLSLVLMTVLISFASGLQQVVHAQDLASGRAPVQGVTTAPTLVSGNSVEEFQQLLLTLAETLELSAQYSGSIEQLQVIDQLIGQVMLMDISQLELLIQNLPPLADLQTRAVAAQQALEISIAQAQSVPTAPAIRSSGSGEIEFPNPETLLVIPGTSAQPCQNIPAELGFSLITAWGIVSEVLAAMKWSCVQTILGENAAELCAPTNIATDLARFAYLGVQFCLKEQRDAYLDAILDTEGNIANYLNDFFDVTVASRASQDSVDMLQQDIDDVNNSLANLQSDLSADFSTTESALDTTLADLNSLTLDLDNLAAITDDIQFRSQVNQVDIEDAQLRAADVQEAAAEIRDDTQSLIALISTLQVSQDDINDDIGAGLDRQTQTALSDALANPDSNVIRFKAPASLGGELEATREVVIQAIIAFGNIGAKTTTAQALLVQGDQAYNQQDYLLAYNLFAQAYQSLTANVAPAKPGFER